MKGLSPSLPAASSRCSLLCLMALRKGLGLREALPFQMPTGCIPLSKTLLRAPAAADLSWDVAELLDWYQSKIHPELQMDSSWELC